MTIRTYEARDRAACLNIFYSNTPRYFDPSELESFEVWLNALDNGRLAYARNDAEHYYVSVQDGAVVACGGFCIPAGKAVAGMAWGMVANEHHKQGIGKQLFEYRLQQIAAHYPGKKVVLDTTQHTYGFFEKMGFTVSGIKKDYYGAGLDRYDMELNALLPASRG